VLRGVRLAGWSSTVRPDGDLLRVTTHLQAVVHFNTRGVNSLSSTAQLDSVLASLRNAVANPGQVAPSMGGVDLSRAQAEPPGVSGAIAVVEVSQAGLTAVTNEGLAAAGLPVTQLDPQRLRLNRLGKDLPIDWEGNGDSVFEPGERLLFYAAPPSAAARRMSLFSGLRMEPDRELPPARLGQVANPRDRSSLKSPRSRTCSTPPNATALRSRRAAMATGGPGLYCSSRAAVQVPTRSSSAPWTAANPLA
jgi:hypothetical protein